MTYQTLTVTSESKTPSPVVTRGAAGDVNEIAIVTSETYDEAIKRYTATIRVRRYCKAMTDAEIAAEIAALTQENA